MTDRPTAACPRCGSTHPTVVRYPCAGISYDPWHDRRPTDRCPRCGSTDPAKRRMVSPDIGLSVLCGDDWHDRPTGWADPNSDPVGDVLRTAAAHERMMQSIWPSTPGEATHALEDDPDPTTDDRPSVRAVLAGRWTSGETILAALVDAGYAVVPAARIEHLERWKAEAITVFDEWEQVWDALGRPGPLGSSKAGASLVEVERLRSDPPDQVDDQ